MFIRFLCLLVTACPILAADPPAGKGPAELQGTWRLVSVEINGTINELKDRQPRLVIKGDRIQLGVGMIAVRNVIIDVACREDRPRTGSQLFVIEPALNSGLVFAEPGTEDRFHSKSFRGR